MTELATPNVVPPVPFIDGAELGLSAPLHPTYRAEEVSPERRAIIAKALMREVRRMKVRLKLRLTILYGRKLALQGVGAALSVLSYFGGNSDKSVNRHGSSPL
jgi:hypothetical protein